MAMSLSLLRVTLGFASAAVGRTHLVHSSPLSSLPKAASHREIGPGSPNFHMRVQGFWPSGEPGGDEVLRICALTRELPLSPLAHVYPELPCGLAVALEGSQSACWRSLAFHWDQVGNFRMTAPVRAGGEGPRIGLKLGK